MVSPFIPPSPNIIDSSRRAARFANWHPIGNWYVASLFIPLSPTITTTSFWTGDHRHSQHVPKQVFFNRIFKAKFSISWIRTRGPQHPRGIDTRHQQLKLYVSSSTRLTGLTDGLPPDRNRMPRLSAPVGFEEDNQTAPVELRRQWRAPTIYPRLRIQTGAPSGK